MKKISNLLTTLAFVSLIIFISCGGGGSDPGPSDLEIAAGHLVDGTWSNPTTVTTDNGLADGDWGSFSIDFSGDTNGGSYQVSNVPTGFSDVWANGNWEFKDGSTTTITRTQGGVSTDMTVSVSETNLTLSFTVPDPNARTSGIAGRWVFIFN